MLLKKERDIWSKQRYWMCIIGPTDQDELPDGADFPMRKAVQETFVKLTDEDAEFECWSGWGLTKERMEEIQKVWNKEE